MDEIFAIWPTVADLARDLGLSYPTVASWRHRGIPANRDREIIEAAARRGEILTYDQMYRARGEVQRRKSAA